MKCLVFAVVALCVSGLQAADVTLPVNGRQAFSATGLDQFGQAMAVQPSVGWSTTIGSVSPGTGPGTTLAAPGSAGSGTLTATAGGLSTSRSVDVTAGGGGDLDPGTYVPASVAMGAAPISGAIILFDGSNATVANQTLTDNWEMWPNSGDAISWQIVEDWGDPSKWTLKADGTTSYGNKDLITKADFGDYEGHVEVLMLGKNDADLFNINGRSNSGIYSENAYEIQIADPRDQDTDGDLFDEVLGEHEIGGIVKNAGPSTNEWRNPGEWHVFHWVYRSARWDGTTMIENPRITVWWNGVKVHDNRTITKNSGGGETDVVGPNGIKLQSNNSDVRFRNFWVNANGGGGGDANAAPTIDATGTDPANGIVTTTSGQLQVSASDADGDPLSYQWAVTSKPNGANPIIGSGANPVVTFDIAGAYVFTVTVSDGRGGLANDSVGMAIRQTASGMAISP